MHAHNFVDLTGRKFERLTVLGIVGKQNKTLVYECRCDCGAMVKVLRSALPSGHTRSCGCLAREITSRARTKHGHNRNPGMITPEYHAYHGMLRRCSNPRRPDYARYGGRGIKVCDRWRGVDGFIRFLEDMGPRPGAEFSLDRIDPNGNYEPGNCRWATVYQQARNRRSVRQVVFEGSPMSLPDACEIAGIRVALVRQRMDRDGWSFERAITTPA